jgi:hypothetical protein
MQMHQEGIDMSQPRRGRPPTGMRKERLQIMLDPDDYQAVVDATATLGETQAEIGRKLVKGEIAWADVVRAAKKARK